jgi:50S ribosomal subunit-associated GTPase HflX
LPQIVVLNKTDLGPPPPFPLADERVLEVVAISCATGAGIAELKQALFRHCPTHELASERHEKGMEELAEFLVYRPRPRARRPFRIYRTDRGYRVVGTVTDEAELAAALAQAGARRDAEIEIVSELGTRW